MRIEIEKTELVRLIGSVARVVEARNTIPILSNLLLTATADTLTVRGTDLDLEATITGEAKCEPGAVCVEAKLLADIVKKVSGTIVVLELADDRLAVKAGRSRFQLATLPAADFPDMNYGTFDAELEIDLAALVAPVQFAISSEETRYYLKGVYLRCADGILTAVATDGHRLARHVTANDVEFAGIIIPRKTVGLIPKGNVKLSVSANKIRVESGGLTLVSKLIDGTFPDYERVIPRNNDKIVTVDREEMVKAADRVASISSERGRAVKLAINPGSVGLFAHSDVGNAQDEVATQYSGEPVEIGFNSKYLAELFSVLPSGEVNIAISESGSPALISSTGMEGWTGVIMPMRV